MRRQPFTPHLFSSMDAAQHHHIISLVVLHFVHHSGKLLRSAVWIAIKCDGTSSAPDLSPTGRLPQRRQRCNSRLPVTAIRLRPEIPQSGLEFAMWDLALSMAASREDPLGWLGKPRRNL